MGIDGTKHVVEAGECLTSIAAAYGFARYTDVYDHPGNAAFKQARPDPNLIAAGDVLVIPSRQARTAACQAGRRHKFRVVTLKASLRFKLEDDQGEALQNKRYRLSVGPRTYAGTTDGGGRLEQVVPVTADAGRLEVFQDEGNGGGRIACWDLAIGHLEPVETVAGVQARLSNLGFPCGPIDGVAGPRTRAAVGRFQLAHGLAETGEVTDRTRAALRDAYGS